MKGNKFLLVSLLALVFAMTGRAVVKMEGFFDTLTASTEFNHNKVLKFSIEAEFKYSVLMCMDITMPASSVPNNVSSVEIVLSDGYAITDEDNPVQPGDGNNKDILVRIDEEWAGLLSYMFGGTGYQYSESKLLENMDKLSRFDIKSIVFTTKEDKEIKVPITYPTTNVFKEIFHSLISVSQSSKNYGEKAKKFFAPYLAKFPLSTASKSTSASPKAAPATSHSTKPSGTTSSTKSSNVSKPVSNSSAGLKDLNPVQFVTNTLGLVTDFSAKSESEIIKVLEKFGIKYTREGNKLVIEQPNYTLLGRPIIQWQLGFKDGLYYECSITVKKQGWTKSQAMAFVKEIYNYMVKAHYKFTDVTSDLGVDFARDYREGYFNFTFWMSTKYEKGKIVGYEITLAKSNYTGLLKNL